VIPRSDELLFRQVNPVLVDDNRVTSQVFRPGGEDGGLLSVHRSTKTSAEGAYRIHTEQKGRRSIGVLCVSVNEAGGIGLNAFDDEETDPVPDPAHALIDFRSLERKQCEKSAKKLRDAAKPRGWQYPNPAPNVLI
jgi:hypothetical protein